MTTTTVINNLTVDHVRRTLQIVSVVRNAPGAGAASCELELRCWGAELERGFFLGSLRWVCLWRFFPRCAPGKPLVQIEGSGFEVLYSQMMGLASGGVG